VGQRPSAVSDFAPKFNPCHISYMVNTAHKGRRFEHDVIRYLKSQGYHCVRSAGSKGAIDIVAMRNGATRLIQCKNGSRIPLSEVAALREFAKTQDKQVEVWTKIPKKPISITIISPDGGMPIMYDLPKNELTKQFRSAKRQLVDLVASVTEKHNQSGQTSKSLHGLDTPQIPCVGEVS
jgi:Holliday junction resolvase